VSPKCAPRNPKLIEVLLHIISYMSTDHSVKNIMPDRNPFTLKKIIISKIIKKSPARIAQYENPKFSKDLKKRI
jgi:hypothetical protein